MDFNLAALKLFIGQLKSLARPRTNITPGAPPTMTFGDLPFQRAWLQGVLVPGSETGSRMLDDGSGVIELQFPKEFKNEQWKVGMYVLVLGAYVIADNSSLIKVHKIVDLSASPDREAMWNLEVIEAYNLFYASVQNVSHF